jgi:hypothetical protein
MALSCDFDQVCHHGRFASSWMRIFIDIPIADDAEAPLLDRVLVFCCVGSSHDVIVVLVVLDTGRYRVMEMTFEDYLNDVDALFVQKILHGLDVVHMESSLCGYSDDVKVSTLLRLHLVF